MQDESLKKLLLVVSRQADVLNAQRDLRRPLGARQSSEAGLRRQMAIPELMPKRTDISSILIIGAGPIVIGQACEFDYSGSRRSRR